MSQSKHTFKHESTVTRVYVQYKCLQLPVLSNETLSIEIT